MVRICQNHEWCQSEKSERRRKSCKPYVYFSAYKLLAKCLSISHLNCSFETCSNLLTFFNVFHKLCELVHVVLLKIEGNDKKVLKKVWLMTAILLVMQNAGSSGRLVIQVLLWVTCATPDKEASVADQLSTLEAYEPFIYLNWRVPTRA